MPVDAVDEMLRVLGFGARKYAPDNWRRGIAYRRVLAAIYRHWSAIMRGEDRDPETGLLHAAHIMCEAAFLTEYQLDGRAELDDRNKQLTVAIEDDSTIACFQFDGRVHDREITLPGGSLITFAGEAADAENNALEGVPPQDVRVVVSVHRRAESDQ
jgi:hypothetical protein